MENAPDLSLAGVAARMEFSTEQVARMCGVSRRQLAYWAQKEIIPSSGYSLETIEKALLLRRELERGRTLKGAVQIVERRLAAREQVRSIAAQRPAAEMDELCRAQLEQMGGLLREICERVNRMDEQERLDVTNQVASLHLERLLGEGASTLSQTELVLGLFRANEHLDGLVSDLPKAI
ncbi:MAG: MerR family transcriptional regulator [Chloroflexota bacterium]